MCVVRAYFLFSLPCLASSACQLSLFVAVASAAAAAAVRLRMTVSFGVDDADLLSTGRKVFFSFHKRWPG